jgi:uncharacterized protein
VGKVLRKPQPLACHSRPDSVRLYSGSSRQFIEDTTLNQIADKLSAAFFQHFRYNPSPAEVGSWRNSLMSMSSLLQYSGLNDHGVILEYQLPQTSKRLDFMICGKDDKKRDNAVIIELKQWERCHLAEGENEVITFVGGAQREVLHPSAQVNQYRMYLQDTHTAFYDGVDPIVLSACSYLHNYRFDANDALLDLRYRTVVEACPLFSKDEVNRMKEHLVARLRSGDGLEVLRRVEESKYRPSRKLMEHVGYVIKGHSEYVLLDDQLIVYDKIMGWARNGFHDRKKAAIIVKGGPGTGKSVIAINLMADLLLKGYNAQYATGSRAFTETLRKVIGTRGSVQFKYFNSYMDAEVDAIDVLVADEAHRIRKTSNSMYTPARDRRDTPQVDELIKASKVSVFFIDDDQVVRPDEIGSVQHIKEAARRNGCDVSEYQLEAQFRCAGSDGFVNWVNNTLGIKRTANVLWEGNEDFDFKIYSSPEELEQAIRQKVSEGYSGRMTAGFCWPWSKANSDGTLVDDVRTGEYRRPWNARPEATRLASGIPKAVHWAHDPNGIEQVGCVYTAQGFEFDFAGVIFGPDLRYDMDEQRWVGHKESSFDTTVKRSGDRFTDLVKNTYRVLLTRGMKGCYVHFMDRDTERFFRSRMEM